jgi:hypothetical protein
VLDRASDSQSTPARIGKGSRNTYVLLLWVWKELQLTATNVCIWLVNKEEILEELKVVPVEEKLRRLFFNG